MKKALFICYGGGHADALIPVMKKLIAGKQIQVEAIGINLAADQIRQSGIPCKSLSNYLDVKSVEIGFPIAKKKHNFDSKVSFADSIAYYGFTVGDLIEEVGEANANKILEIYDRRTMFPVATMLRILEVEKPDVIVTTTMNRFEAAALRAAEIMNIPSVKIEDLIGKINKTFPDKIQVDSEEEKESLVAQGISKANIVLKADIMNPIIASYCEKVYQTQLKIQPTVFAVSCDFAKSVIESRGLDSKSIIVTGQPAFDQHPYYLENTSRDEICNELGLNLYHPIVVFMSQPCAEREDIFRALIAAYKDLKDDNIQLVVKLHPNEDGKIQRIMLQEQGVHDVVICKNIDARSLIAISDLVMTAYSTTGIEAAVMGKPLVYINVSGEEDHIPFDKMGIGVRCCSSKQIAETLHTFLIENKELNLPMIHSFKTDGKASERVANIVIKLACLKDNEEKGNDAC
ncbi:MAG: UDP-N-acetylglucosamine 2-epimerase [Eubacteriales bacterium]|nr:UDP-N-acetylglucosamine 2-epimerase [Eubacteriales bacterium]